MTEHEQNFSSQRFDTMPSAVRDTLKFCTSAVEWSLDKRWRNEGDIVKFREELTQLYENFQNESDDQENLATKLLKYGDLYNKLQKSFILLKEKYEGKQGRILKNETKIREQIGGLEVWGNCYEYPDKYEVFESVKKEGYFSQEEIEKAVTRVCSFTETEFEKKDKNVNFREDIVMELGDYCPHFHGDLQKISFLFNKLVEDSSNGILSVVEIIVQDIYDKDNYPDDEFERNDFTELLYDYFDGRDKTIKLPSGEVISASVDVSVTKKHMDDNCCQRDLRLFLFNIGIEDLKKILRIFLNDFIKNQRIKK